MSSSRQSNFFAVFHERVKRVVTNGTFQWFVGIIVAITGLIIALLTYMQNRRDVKVPDDQVAPPQQVEHKATHKDTVMQDQRNVTDSDDQAVPQNYTLIEHQPLFAREARTNLSVLFQTIEGEEFVSLNIAPAGREASVRPVLRGYTEDFTSSDGVFNVQILDIDYSRRKVAIYVSRKT